MKKIINGEKGITLIALIVTIIVLLILSGITMVTIFGNNGMEVHLEISDLTLIDHLGKEGYFKDYDSNNKKDSYIINIERFKDSRLGKGKDKSTGDVYVVEKENEQSDIVVLRYYKTSTEVEDLLKLNGE